MIPRTLKAAWLPIALALAVLLAGCATPDESQGGNNNEGNGNDGDEVNNDTDDLGGMNDSMNGSLNDSMNETANSTIG